MLCKIHFFHEMSKKLEKEAGNNFVLSYQMRNMIGRSWKFIFIDQSRSYNFSHQEKSKKVQKILAFYSNWVVHITRDFLACYFCSHYSSIVINMGIKGMLQQTFCTDINTESDRNWKIMWNLLNMFKLLLIFFIDISNPII